VTTPEVRPILQTQTFAGRRFEATFAKKQVILHDRLLPEWEERLQMSSLPAAEHAGLEKALFELGFAPAVVRGCGQRIASRPRHSQDVQFWQFPCITEAAAWSRHAGENTAVLDGEVLHCYLPVPWATWIDKMRRQQGDAAPAVEPELQLARVRFSGLRRALVELGVSLHVHTVCQHIYWADMLPQFEQLGITDLWLSHLTEEASGSRGPFRLHPWALYAVNVEDSTRRQGIEIGKDPKNKSLIASFIGAHMDHYPSQGRLRLRELAAAEGFHIEVNEKWHFEDVVYEHQMGQKDLPTAYKIGSEVEKYNRVLSDSRFSLCPAGAGLNTLRLWESLAVGSVPVHIGARPKLPEGGTLAGVDWDQIVLYAREEEIPELPGRLRAVPLDEVRRRQQLGLEAYAKVKRQRCF
jgi:hypothetical protein